MINIITMNSPYCRYLEFYSVVIVYSVSFKELAYCLLCYGRIMLIYRVFLFLAGYGSIVPEGGSVIGGKCQVNGSLPTETVSLSLRVINPITTLFCASVS